MQHAIELLSQAVAHQQGGRLLEAIGCYRELIRLRPDFGDAHSRLAGLLFAQKRYRESETCCREAVRIQPQSAAWRSNLAAVLIRLGRFAEAETEARQAVQCDPGNAGAHNNLANALLEQERLDAAEECFRRALTIAPDDHALMVGLGNALRLQLRLAEARRIYDLVLKRDPRDAAARMNRAVTLLLSGHWEDGWKDYEARWDTGEIPNRPFQQLEWDGSPLNGRRILLHAEQGLGDTLQFVRYAPLVKQRGGDVVLECQPALCQLLQRAEGVDHCYAAGAPPPEFDVHAPLLSLPRIFGSTPETVPRGVPYLRAAPQRSHAWKQKFEAVHGFKVGVVWAGNPRHRDDRRRSLDPSLLRPLTDVPGVTLFALQPVPPPQGFLSLWTGLVEDTAAIISNLDLVISVDTMAAHLAGALGRPGWVLLSYVPDYRWLLDREDTPWYPTLRLFRQSNPGDWQEVIERVASALTELVRQADERPKRLTPGRATP